MLFILGTTFVVASTVINKSITTNPDLEDGLVGHWTFDGPDITADQILDRSGSGNHGGFIGGATSSAATQGKIGQGLEFDGVDDRVDAGTSVEDFNGLNEMTLAMWLYRDPASSGADGVMRRGTGSGSPNKSTFRLSLTSSDKLQFNADFASGNLPTYTSIDSFPKGEWVHALIRYDGTDIRFYQNGIEDSGGAQAETSTWTSGDTFSTLIGQGWTTSARYFQGKMDDVRLYNRGLSVEEVSRLYDLGATTYINKTITSNPDLENGLVGHWTFDGPDMDLSSSTAQLQERTGNGPNMALGGFTTSTTVVPGKIGQALAFDGVNDYANTPEANVPAYDSPLTFSVWMRTNSDITSNQLIMSYGLSVPTYLQVYNGNVRWILNNTTAALISTPATANTWSHLVGTYDASLASENLKLYVNGTLVGTDNYTTAVNNTSAQLVFGARVSTLGLNFDGTIDDVRIYERPLSADEITRLYDLGATTYINKTITTNPNLKNGLVGHWTFDGPDMIDSVTDRSGNDAHGFFAAGVATSSVLEIGKIGQAVSFTGNGTDDYITMGNASSLSPTEAITLSAWVRRSTVGSRDMFISKGAFLSGTDGQYWFEFNTNNTLELTLYEEGVSNTESVVSAQTIADTEWHHVVGTYDGATLRLYVDGAADVNTTSAAITIRTRTNNFVIGDRSSLYSIPYGGLIDDVRIYNRALSAQEVTRLYQLGT
jgi:hypothetical protein